MFHYTYIIQDTHSEMRYIGARSSKVPPTEDTSYWGSSKYLPEDVRGTHRKIILKVFDTREKAIQHEIELHELNDVARSPKYYNKSKQTSTKFDTTGISHVCSEDAKKRISKSNSGKKRTKAQNEAQSVRQKGHTWATQESIAKHKATYKANGKTKGTKHHNFKPWFIATEEGTREFYYTTKAEQSVIDGHYPKYYADITKKQNKQGSPLKTHKYGKITIGFLTD